MDQLKIGKFINAKRKEKSPHLFDRVNGLNSLEQIF